jgi:hypothetical protein
MSKLKRKTPAVGGRGTNHKGAGLRLVSSNGWTIKQAAIALLTRNDPPLNRYAGRFLGDMAVVDGPLNERQAAYLARLLSASGLPQIEGAQ